MQKQRTYHILTLGCAKNAWTRRACIASSPAAAMRRERAAGGGSRDRQYLRLYRAVGRREEEEYCGTCCRELCVCPVVRRRRKRAVRDSSVAERVVASRVQMWERYCLTALSHA